MISKSLCNPLPLNLCNPGGGIFQVPSLVHSSPSTLFRGPVFQAARAVFCGSASVTGNEARFWHAQVLGDSLWFLWHPGLCLVEVSGWERLPRQLCCCVASSGEFGVSLGLIFYPSNKAQPVGLTSSSLTRRKEMMVSFRIVVPCLLPQERESRDLGEDRLP